MDMLLDEILKDLGVELGLLDPETFDVLEGKAQDVVMLKSKIKASILEVKEKRNYQIHHDDEFVWADMELMYAKIRNLALYDWNLIGAEGQTSHSDNGTSRSYINRAELLSGIVPFVKVL